MAMNDGLGINFAPTQAQQRQQAVGNPLQQAIQVLSLRLPKWTGARQTPIPQSILGASPGSAGAGLGGSVAQSILAQLVGPQAGQAQSAMQRPATAGTPYAALLQQLTGGGGGGVWNPPTEPPIFVPGEPNPPRPDYLPTPEPPPPSMPMPPAPPIPTPPIPNFIPGPMQAGEKMRRRQLPGGQPIETSYGVPEDAPLASYGFPAGGMKRRP